MTLASILIRAGRAGLKLDAAEVCETMQISDAELREDINVLNVVNFGGGSYVLYAEIDDAGAIEVDPEPYSDNFARPARLLPVEAKALVAAIDLIGEHLPEGSLQSAREKIVAALGSDPMQAGLHVADAGGDDSRVARVASEAINRRRLLRLDYYKSNEDEYTTRVVEPYALVNGREGWYVACFDPERDDVRHFRLDRIRHAEVTETPYEPRPEVNPAAELDGWLRTGEVQASRIARVWVSTAAGALGARAAPRRVRSSPTARSSSSCRSRAPTSSCATCSPRPATPPCSSRPRRVRPCWPPSSGCAPPPCADVNAGPRYGAGYR